MSNKTMKLPAWLVGIATLCTALLSPPVLGDAAAQSFTYASPPSWPGAFDDEETLPQHESGAVSPYLQRQVVSYTTREAPGTVIIDTPNTVLYYVIGGGRAIRYGVGVGREGFTWAGVKNISRKAEWPDWNPPAEMIARQPYLPRFMAGGPGNPLGARAMYLGGTIYRIHGTNDPTTIGKFVSSGCIRMTNENAIDLYQRVNLGTKVVVLPMRGTPALARRNATRPVAQALDRPEMQTATIRNANAFVLY
jgi:lipoprotein-anchoring transpeptidase ErfK/SrfK